MAYRPNVIRPPVQPNPRALIEARMQRQALVKALADRLSLLLNAFQQAPSTDFPRPRASPSPVFRAPPAGPSQALLPPPFRPGTTPVQAPEWLPSWPAPSARDWRSMPGFYESDIPQAGRF